MQFLDVPVPGSPHQVALGRGALADLGALLRERGLTGSALLVTNQVVAPLYAQLALGSLHEAGIKAWLHVVPDGEQHKNLRTLGGIYRACLRWGLERRSTIVALGGGVVGDLAGCAAATYMRGLRLVQAPTSLLAQVDSSIGGKVAVDFGGRKNLVGAFYQPSLVVTDPSMLDTLPPEQWRCGLAEIIKAAVIASPALFRTLEEHGLSDQEDVIRQALAIKIAVISADPLESGLREILNFGHTIAHGIEAASQYRIPHGDAVSVGMLAATRLAVRVGSCPAQIEGRLVRLLQSQGLPTSMPFDITVALKAMNADKKKRGGRLRFVLPTDIGRVEVIDSISPALVQDVMEEIVRG